MPIITAAAYAYIEYYVNPSVHAVITMILAAETPLFMPVIMAVGPPWSCT
jgi:hypothetical protein